MQLAGTVHKETCKLCPLYSFCTTSTVQHTSFFFPYLICSIGLFVSMCLTVAHSAHNLPQLVMAPLLRLPW